MQLVFPQAAAVFPEPRCEELDGTISAGRYLLQVSAGLAASFRVSFLSRPCRKKKSHMCSAAVQTAQQEELEAKQALVHLNECSPNELRKEEPVPQDERSGEVVVQWKDGTVTSLYTEKSEDTL